MDEKMAVVELYWHDIGLDLDCTFLGFEEVNVDDEKEDELLNNFSTDIFKWVGF